MNFNWLIQNWTTGRITIDELIEISIAVYALLGCNVSPAYDLKTCEDHANKVFSKLDVHNNGYITFDQFLEICLKVSITFIWTLVPFNRINHFIQIKLNWKNFAFLTKGRDYIEIHAIPRHDWIAMNSNLKPFLMWRSNWINPFRLREQNHQNQNRNQNCSLQKTIDFIIELKLFC